MRHAKKTGLFSPVTADYVLNRRTLCLYKAMIFANNCVRSSVRFIWFEATTFSGGVLSVILRCSRVRKPPSNKQFPSTSFQLRKTFFGVPIATVSIGPQLITRTCCRNWNICNWSSLNWQIELAKARQAQFATHRIVSLPGICWIRVLIK